tara:strand:- start:1066 stop:1464 length:399 start_codon:yes stop_codon:yes gene_type:complete
MIAINIEKTKQENDEHHFTVFVTSSSKVKKHYAHQKSIVKEIVNKFGLENYNFISSKSAGDLTKYNNVGVYVFKIEKKPVDILNNSVKIDEITVEAESLKKEQKNEASLPYGLKKQTKTKRKRATKNKTTEG